LSARVSPTTHMAGANGSVAFRAKDVGSLGDG
jgi:hypothetical protein